MFYLFNLETRCYLGTGNATGTLVYSRKDALGFRTKELALEHLEKNSNFIVNLKLRNHKSSSPKSWRVDEIYSI